jgi:hypothetical protein
MEDVEKHKDGCWLWEGEHKTSGYGVFYLTNSLAVHAHRFAYVLWIGELPRRMCVMHTCDNRLCVNPAHLKLGTHKENTQDALAKGRLAVGERNHQAKLTDEIVRTMRQEYQPGRGEFKRLGQKYGVKETAARKAVLGITWQHVS